MVMEEFCTKLMSFLSKNQQIFIFININQNKVKNSKYLWKAQTETKYFEIKLNINYIYGLFYYK